MPCNVWKKRATKTTRPMKNSSEEAAWIARCVLWDDRRAFAHLVEKYQVRLRRFLLHLTGGDSYLADDLAQDTFVRAYERIRSYKGLSSFSTWLFPLPAIFSTITAAVWRSSTVSIPKRWPP